jgi:hypothetical protein
MAGSREPGVAPEDKLHGTMYCGTCTVVQCTMAVCTVVQSPMVQYTMAVCTVVQSPMVQCTMADRTELGFSGWQCDEEETVTSALMNQAVAGKWFVLTER